MIPLHITVNNFRGIPYAEVDFTTLHCATVTGPNGAGKSSLLTLAPTYALFGEVTGLGLDELVMNGEREMSVQFEFEHRGHVYRILRARSLKGNGKSSLELQEQMDNSLWMNRSHESGKIKDTEAVIRQLLQLDAATFTASSMILQNKANEFTSQLPSQRKETLKKIIGLHIYDQMKDKAKAKADLLQEQIAKLKGKQSQLEEHLASLPEKEQAYARQQQALVDLQQRLQQAGQELKKQEARIHQLERQQEQLLQMEKRMPLLKQELDELRGEQEKRMNQHEVAAKILDHEDEILAKTEQYQKLEAQKVALNVRLPEYQRLEEELRRMEQRSHQNQAQLQPLLQRVQELEGILAQRVVWLTHAEAYQSAVTEVNRLDGLQNRWQDSEKRLFAARMDWSGKQQQAALIDQALQTVKITQQKLELGEKEIHQQQGDLNRQLAERPHIEAQLVAYEEARSLDQEMKSLFQSWDAYNRKIQEAQTAFAAEERRLQFAEQQLQTEISNLESKAKMLEQAECVDISRAGCRFLQDAIEAKSQLAIKRQELADMDRTKLDFFQSEEDRLTQEQLTLGYDPKEHRSIQDKVEELQQYVQKAAQLEAKLEVLKQLESRLQHIHQQQQEASEEVNRLLQKQAEHLGAIKLSEQMYRELEKGQQTIGYDTNMHQETKERARQLQPYANAAEQLQEKEERLAELQGQIQSLQTQSQEEAGKKQATYALWQTLHEAFAALPKWELELAELKRWAILVDQLPVRRQQKQDAQERLDKLFQLIPQKEQEQAELKQEHLHLQAQIHAGDLIRQQRIHMQMEQDELHAKERFLIGQLGGLEAELAVLRREKVEWEQIGKDMEPLARTWGRYQILVRAFGRDGIPTLVIENTIPQLERIANDILSEMSGGEHTLRLETQKEKKNGDGLIETLDILVADWRGERKYETYSGGQQLRIDLALCIALAELLAMRAGSKIEWLTIDEGLGSQDAEHLDLVLQSIQRIASRFKKVIVITHIETAKAVFGQSIIFKKNGMDRVEIEIAA